MMFEGASGTAVSIVPLTGLVIPVVAALWFLHRHATRPASGEPRPASDQWLLFLAEGLGSGRLRPGPGTWGSLVGIAWCLVLFTLSQPLVVTAVVAAAILAAVPVCAAAERILGRHDPGSVVLDEIVAVPLALLPWLWLEAARQPAPPSTGDLLSGAGLVRLGLAFVLFRILDIWKPWPIRPCQRLRGGWGVVADDVVAGLLAGGLGVLWH